MKVAAKAKRWTLILLAAGAVLLVPWMVVLALTLPADTQVRNWSLAWIGLDVLMAAGCAATALLGLRGDPRARLTASATAAVAVLDAWFDITTAQPGADLVEALACATAEAALACACVFLAVGKDRINPALSRRGSAIRGTAGDLGCLRGPRGGARTARVGTPGGPHRDR